MNHPFWLINNALLFLLTLTSLFVYLSHVSVPEREDIEPVLYSKTKKEQHIAINIKHIYENDLFDTYQKELPAMYQPAALIPFPEPPRPQQPILPEPPKPKFLEPLAITLKGIIVVSSDDNKNRAIISLNKTDQESTYKVGDTIEDAQLIRIFNNKIIFLRPNGQQEVIYLREQDAKLDPAYSALGDWNTVVQKEDDYHYTVNPKAFIKRVRNIAQCIDMFGLTTAYQKGKSIGTRIGIINDTSLPAALGFIAGDIIMSVNGITTNTTDNRLEIYNQIINTKLNNRIELEIVRKNRPITLEYILATFGTDEDQFISTSTETKTIPKTAGTVPEKEAFANTLQKMNDRERHNMLAQGRIPDRV